jgi:hypothetical protein
MKNKLVCSVILVAAAMGGLAGCSTASKSECLSHEIWTYSESGNVTRKEVWSESHEGGGTALMANPETAQIASYHTNQSGLGGASVFTVGNVGSRVAPMTVNYSPVGSSLATGSAVVAGTNGVAGK